MKKFEKIIGKFHAKRILVVGDVILDRYIQGAVSRISPEAPVPVVLEQNSFYTPGGAANVGHNLSALGATVIQVGRIGNDFEGKLLKRELKRENIDTSGIFVDATTPTVTKTRVMAQHQQVVRIDKEKVGVPLKKELAEKVLAFIKKRFLDVDGVIISDYGKGLVGPDLLKVVCRLALQKGVPIVVDPKVEHFGSYRNVTAITPNKKEIENAIRHIKVSEDTGSQLKVKTDNLVTLQDIKMAGRQLLAYLNLTSLLVTLGEEGMCLFEKGKDPVHIPTKAKDVFDVTGAGDAVISVFTLSLTAQATKIEAAQLANIAAGVVVGKMGAVPVSKNELLAELKKGI